MKMDTEGDYSLPPDFTNHYHKVVITTGASYSANVLRFYGAVDDPGTGGDNGGGIQGGFTGWITNIEIREVESFSTSVSNLNVINPDALLATVKFEVVVFARGVVASE